MNYIQFYSYIYSMIEIVDQRFMQALKADEKTILVKEGEISRKMFFIKKGCVRIWFNNNGKEQTIQFLFEGEVVTSLESFLNNEPSPFTIETMEECEISVLNKKGFEELMSKNHSFKDWFYETTVQRLMNYSHRLVSYIKNKPEDRYAELLKQQPFVLRRLPQHYISAYLGITDIAFSRFKNKK
ncbi:MAG: Crp/Fnr family transcriptional regulator [Bacteroidota bacterium]|nr:Crp/Fnr family transcriptional regulator [Bacteroidota bacterium]